MPRRLTCLTYSWSILLSVFWLGLGNREKEPVDGYVVGWPEGTRQSGEGKSLSSPPSLPGFPGFGTFSAKIWTVPGKLEWRNTFKVLLKNRLSRLRTVVIMEV